MRSRKLALLCVALVVATLPTTPALAAPGDLDQTFGVGGRVTTDLGGSADSAFRAVLRPTGEILVGGIVSSTTDIGVVQYHPDGSVDTAFGVAGLASVNLGADDQGIATMVQLDGKVVVAGHTTIAGPRDWVVVRFNADGSLDTSFGTNGSVTTDFAGEDQLNDGLLQPDGKIVVAGFSSPAGRRWALARYNSDGSLDTSFGAGGKVTTAVGGSDQIVRAIALQPDGKIVAAGFDGSNVVVGRYLTNGVLDGTFGTAGIVVTDIAGSGRDLGFAVAVLESGHILVGGMANNADFALLRYQADGTLDASFGSGGIVTTDFGFGQDIIYALSELPNGQYLTTGEARAPARSFGIALYNNDGTLDAGFGSGGLVTTDFGGDLAVSRDVVVQPDNKALVVGVTIASGNADFALARYLLNRDPIEIDIKPGAITLQLVDGGLIVADPEALKVIAFGSDDFDMATIDPTTARLKDPALGPEVAAFKWKFKDKNGDGIIDLVLRFRPADLLGAGGLDEFTSTFELTATSFDGVPMVGSGPIEVMIGE